MPAGSVHSLLLCCRCSLPLQLAAVACRCCLLLLKSLGSRDRGWPLRLWPSRPNPILVIIRLSWEGLSRHPYALQRPSAPCQSKQTKKHRRGRRLYTSGRMRVQKRTKRRHLPAYERLVAGRRPLLRRSAPSLLNASPPVQGRRERGRSPTPERDCNELEALVQKGLDELAVQGVRAKLGQGQDDVRPRTRTKKRVFICFMAGNLETHCRRAYKSPGARTADLSGCVDSASGSRRCQRGSGVS
jgi:hypothetical protein